MKRSRVGYWVWLSVLALGCGDSGTGEAGAGGTGGTGGTGGMNSAPTDIQLSANAISECAPAGTAVGTLSVTDPDAGDTHALELVPLMTDTDAFELVGAELRTRRALDFETEPSIDVAVRATDSGGLSVDRTFGISVTDEVDISSLDDAGPGTLRDALTTAPDQSTICVAPGLTGTITLTTGPIAVSNTLTLVGPGLSFIVSGGDAQSILLVEASGDLTLSGVTLTSADGSAIRNDGTLTLQDAVVRDSLAPGTGRGACLASRGPQLSVSRVSFVNCSSFNAGAVDLGDGNYTFDSASFIGNSTTGNSGAAMIVDAAGDVSITNSTFSGNFTTGADRVGGAIGVFSDFGGGNLVLRHNTFFGNSATGEGGAIYLAATAVVELEGNLFENNTATTGGPDIFQSVGATATSLGHNLLEDGTDSGLMDGVDNDIVGLSAMLGALSDNGGPTMTHLPIPASPAVDAIPAASCSVDVDQRGEPRPAGAGCDIGAVER